MSTSFNPPPTSQLQSGYGSHLTNPYLGAEGKNTFPGIQPTPYEPLPAYDNLPPGLPRYSGIDPNRPPYMMTRPQQPPTDRFNHALSQGIRKALNPWAVTKDLFISGILTLPLWLFGLHIPIIALWTGGRMIYRAVKGALEGFSTPAAPAIQKHHRMGHHANKNNW